VLRLTDGELTWAGLQFQGGRLEIPGRPVTVACTSG
jgi:hypothetical protein